MNYLTRRDALANGFWALAGGAQVPRRLMAPVSISPVIYSNMVGCIGTSLNPDVTAKILRAVSVGLPDDDFVSKPGLSACFMGTMPEFNCYANIGTDANKANLLVRFLTDPHSVIVEDNYKSLPRNLPPIMRGFYRLYSRINYGDYIAAFAQDDELYLFRDGDKPFCVMDARPMLGQVFFAPSAEAMQKGLKRAKIPVQMVPPILIELPDKQIWRLQQKGSGEWNCRKFKVTKTKYFVDSIVN